MVTYTLFKTHIMLLSAPSREGQADGDLQPVQNPDHALVSSKQGRPDRWWLTTFSKPRSCSCQLQAGKARQMVPYSLFKTQTMLLSAPSRRPDRWYYGNLQPVQNPDHALVSYKQGRPGRWCLTSYLKPRECSVSCKQGRPTRWWPTCCSKPRGCSCQLQAGKASQMVTYTLFKTQGMLLWATIREGQPNVDLQPVQNPQHALVSYNQGRPAQWWLTACSKPRACSCQQQAGIYYMPPGLQTIYQVWRYALISIRGSVQAKY